MREVVTLLSSGEGRSEDKDVQIEILPITPETGLDQINELLQLAESNGWAGRRISNCLYIEAYDLRNLESVEATKNAPDAERERLTEDWLANDDFVHHFNSLDLFAFTPNCAPFSVFPFSSRTCVELMVGKKFYVSFLNLDAVAREFKHRGWTIKTGTKELLEEKGLESLLNVSKGPFRVNVPPSEYARMAMEAMRPKTLIQAFEYLREQGPMAEQGYLLPLYEGEATIEVSSFFSCPSTRGNWDLNGLQQCSIAQMF